MYSANNHSLLQKKKKRKDKKAIVNTEICNKTDSGRLP